MTDTRARDDGHRREGAGPVGLAYPYDGDLEIVNEVTVRVTGTVTGRIHVAGPGILLLSGVAQRGVVVTGGGHASISGETAVLVVAAGGHATLTGTCHDAVINDGGEVVIEGLVEGPVIQHAGQTVIGPAARIGGDPGGPAQTQVR